jgi:ribonuclease P protein subunit RPR2
LFELAQKNEEYSKRYLSLAKRIGEKLTVSIPKELQKQFCKKCFSLKVIQTEETPFLVVTCKECGFVKRYSLKK